MWHLSHKVGGRYDIMSIGRTLDSISPRESFLLAVWRVMCNMNWTSKNRFHCRIEQLYLPWPSPQHRIMRLNLPFPSSTKFLVYLPKKENGLRNTQTDIMRSCLLMWSPWLITRVQCKTWRLLDLQKKKKNLNKKTRQNKNNHHEFSWCQQI